jgi:Aspartyl protease
MRVADQHISTSIRVLEQREGVQFIFGLDNLRRHQCVIDLQKGVLVIGSCGVELPFLPSHKIPADFNTKRQRPDDQVSRFAIRRHIYQARKHLCTQQNSSSAGVGGWGQTCLPLASSPIASGVKCTAGWLCARARDHMRTPLCFCTWPCYVFEPGTARRRCMHCMSAVSPHSHVK